MVLCIDKRRHKVYCSTHRAKGSSSKKRKKKMTTTYYTATETAKIVRAALKVEFPGTKFSVRKSGYNSITVQVAGGKELAAKVEELVRNYRGADFDGMTDCKNFVRHMVNGQEIQYGADFIFVNYDRKVA